jgi:hypothetical protein
VTGHRGYLWQDLTGEVIAEFAALGVPMQLSELIRLGVHIVERVDTPRSEAQPKALRSRRLYARSVVAGKCVKCAQPARTDKKTCARCSEEASRRSAARKRKIRAAALEERCRGLNDDGRQCAMSRLDCRSNHGGRTLDDSFSEYREQLAQLSAEAIEIELVSLRGELSVKDMEYSLLREQGGSPDDALLAESQRLRTKLNLAEHFAAKLRKQPHGYVYDEDEYEDEVSDAVDE